MKISPWITLGFILLLTLFAGWVALPGGTLDAGSFKADHPIQEGLDLQGGVQVLLQANPPAGTTVDKDTLQGTRDTIERRVGGLGVSEPLVQTRGNNQIIVELPGVTDPEQAVEVVRQTALLEIIDTNGQYLAPGTVVNTSLGSSDSVNGGTPTADGSPVASPEASPVAAGGEQRRMGLSSRRSSVEPT